MTREELEAEAERMLAPSLRSALKSMTQRQLDNENITRAYDMGRDMERAAVVAWLRGEPERLVACSGHRHADGKPCLVLSPMPAEELADAIERGDHRREEKP